MFNYFAKAQDTTDYRSELMNYVLLTGGNCLIPGFSQRVEQELRMVNPTEMKINVVSALDARIDAWRGGALFAQTHFKGAQLKDYTISKKEFEECGHHYIKEHRFSNFLYGQRPTQKKEF